MEKDFLGYDINTTECTPEIFSKRGNSGLLNIKNVISKNTASQIIMFLNTFQRHHTIVALKLLFEHFIWNFNNLQGNERRFIDVIFTPPIVSYELESMIKEKKSIDDEGTASTDGYKLWINVKRIMNKEFDEKDTHFGKLPKGVSHYASVILHEFGHIIRERANETTFQYIVDKSPDFKKCLRQYQIYIHEAYEEKKLSYKRGDDRKSDIFNFILNQRKDELEEWIADMFAKSFIIYAFGPEIKKKKKRTQRIINNKS